MDLGLIRSLSEKRTGGMRKLAADIGMSEANLHRCVNNNKIQAADLEKIALLLEIDIRHFFEKEASSPASNIATANGNSSVAAINSDIKVSHNTLLEEKVKYLEDLLTEKERLINVLMNKK